MRSDHADRVVGDCRCRCAAVRSPSIGGARSAVPAIEAARQHRALYDLDRLLDELYDRSPTFKAQCERLAAAGNLHVVVRLDSSLPSRCRAVTNIRRRGREMYADVHLPPGRAVIELVAHEFEHVIEQVEGLNLRVLARTRGSGVREIERELFESDRATKAGHVVADEARRPLRIPAAD